MTKTAVEESNGGGGTVEEKKTARSAGPRSQAIINYYRSP
jgi:hypothetical protein